MAKLHKNARTTPEIRQAIQKSELSNQALAKQYNIDVATVRKWRKRTYTHDSNPQERNNPASMSPLQEQFSLLLRKILCLSLDDLLRVSVPLLKNNLSRSTLNRALRQAGISAMRQVLPILTHNQSAPTFKQSSIGTWQICMFEIPIKDTQDSPQFLFTALERSSRWFYASISKHNNAIDFLHQLQRYSPIAIQLLFIKQPSRHPPFNEDFFKYCKRSHFRWESVDAQHTSTQPTITTISQLLEDCPGLTHDADTFNAFLQQFMEYYNNQTALHSLAELSPSAKAAGLEKTLQNIEQEVSLQKPSNSTLQTTYRNKISLDKGAASQDSTQFIFNTRRPTMANANDTIDALMKTEGAVAAIIADSDSGLVLAAKSNGTFDTDTAAAGNTRVVQAKRDTMRMLNLNDKIEDILITLGTQLHLIAPYSSNDAVFGYLVVSKSGANLGMARASLKNAMSTLVI